MVYSKDFKLKCIKHYKLGFSSISEVAEIKNIPKQTLSRWLNNHHKFGEISLENKKPGAKELEINSKT